MKLSWNLSRIKIPWSSSTARSSLLTSTSIFLDNFVLHITSSIYPVVSPQEISQSMEFYLYNFYCLLAYQRLALYKHEKCLFGLRKLRLVSTKVNIFWILNLLEDSIPSSLWGEDASNLQLTQLNTPFSPLLTNKIVLRGSRNRALVWGWIQLKLLDS